MIGRYKCGSKYLPGDDAAVLIEECSSEGTDDDRTEC